MDDFERQVGDMLAGRVAHLADTYEISPESVSRARRVRTTKLTALGAALVIVVVGTAGAIAQSSRDEGPHRVITSTPTSTPASTLPRPSVRTVGCPTVSNAQLVWVAPPSTTPRVPSAGDPATLSKLASFAAADDPRYVVLGPESWSCHARAAEEHTVVVYDAAVTPGMVPSVDAASIVISNNPLWNDPWGALLACSVFDDPAIVQFTSRNYDRNCLSSNAARTVTRTSAHVATFVDADGDRGVGWMVLPSSDSANDGKISVLECRPSTGQISAAACDTIIADYAARVAVETLPSTAPRPSVRTVECPVIIPDKVDGSWAEPVTTPRVPTAGDAVQLATLQSFAANPEPRYVVLGPASWSCRATPYLIRGTMIVFDGTLNPGIVPSPGDAPITVYNEWLRPPDFGSRLACSVFDDPALTDLVRRNAAGDCPRDQPQGRIVTRVDAHIASFVDTNGDSGAGRMILPSSDGANDGRISVLECRPSTGQISTAACDTIVADWIARNDTSG